MTEMSITRGLAELKLLKNRIYTVTNGLQPIAMSIGKKSVTGFTTIEEFNKKAVAGLQSANDLIKRRSLIKSAIVNSNANTMVTIAGVTMTVATAIERKTSIDFEKALLIKLQSEYTKVMLAVDKENTNVKNRLDKLLETNFTSGSRAKEDEVEIISKPFMEANEAKVQDPLKLKDIIDNMTQSILEFETEVDFVLSESNTRTTIQIED